MSIFLFLYSLSCLTNIRAEPASPHIPFFDEFDCDKETRGGELVEFYRSDCPQYYFFPCCEENLADEPYGCKVGFHLPRGVETADEQTKRDEPDERLKREVITGEVYGFSSRGNSEEYDPLEFSPSRLKSQRHEIDLIPMPNGSHMQEYIVVANNEGKCQIEPFKPLQALSHSQPSQYPSPQAADKKGSSPEPNVQNRAVRRE